MSTPLRILLGQLGSFGDCLFATAVARQIKEDFPGCQLTWAVGSPYASILKGNPHVDRTWVIPIEGRRDLDDAWRRFERLLKKAQRAKEYDRVFLTQLGPNNYQNFDGTVRASIFRGYPRPIRVPVTPVLRLLPEEVEKARGFVERHGLTGRANVLLFECAPESGQSFVTVEFALAASRDLLRTCPDTVIVISSSRRLPEISPGIIDGSELSLRETVELTKAASLLVGCSSGISWACTSDAARPLPMVQLLKRSTSVFASMSHDAAFFGLPREHILEMTDCTPSHLALCLGLAIDGGFDAARAKFHEEIPVKLDLYLERFMLSVLKQGQPMKVLRSLRHVYRRYGAAPFTGYVREKFERL